MLQIILYLLLSLPIIVFLAYLYVTWNHSYWRKRGLPTAEPLTIFGTFPNVIFKRRNTVFDINDVYIKYKKLHRAVGVFKTRKPEILILDPKLVNNVLVADFASFQDTITSSWVDDRNDDKLISRNPFWCAGEEWKMRRSEAVTGLTQNKLKQSYPIWQSTCQRLQKFLEIKTPNGKAIIETKDLSYRFTADVMCDFIWGIDAGTFSQADKTSTIVEVTGKWTTYTLDKPSYYEFITIAPFIRLFHKERFHPRVTDQFFMDLQSNAIDLRKKQGDTDRPDFLNHLLQLNERKKLELEDFTGHSLTVMLDGYETSAMVLTYCLFYLAKYTEAQQKLRQEIASSLQNSENLENNQLSYEELISLPYLDQCIHETLRLISIIPYFSRICVKPTTLEVAPGKTLNIEPGIVAVIPVYSLHSDEEYYPEPGLFKPERFDDCAHSEMTKKGIFLPFGDGPRICMGMRVGLLSVKAALVEIFAKFSVTTCPLTLDVTNISKTSILLALDGDVFLEFNKLQC